MIRHDFVSNSSSCSFMIKNPSDICDKISLDDLNLLFTTVPTNYSASYDNGYISFRCDKDYSSKILDYKTDKLKIKKDDNSHINIDGIDSVYDLRVSDIDFITQLFRESESIEFNYGLDDCGTKSGYVGAIIGVLLDHLFDIQIDSEEYDTDTINMMFKKLRSKKQC